MKNGRGGGGARAFTLDDIDPILELPHDPPFNAADDAFDTSLFAGDTYGIESITIDELDRRYVWLLTF